MLHPNIKMPASIIAALFATTSLSHALVVTTTPLYSGGTTSVEKVYRDIFNCYGNHAGGDTLVGLTLNSARCNTETPANNAVEPLYLGSGNGKTAFVTHDASRFTDGARTPDAVPVPSTRDFGPFYGTGTGGSWIPSSTGPFFPTVSFTTSDEPLSAADIAAYNTNGAGRWGAPIQVPGNLGVIAVPFRQTAVWNEQGDPLGGASSLVSVTTDTLCGIFTGAITNWNDNAFKAANNNTQLGNGPITVFYRNDNSGGTFLFSNALIAQCARTSHPIPALWQIAPGNASAKGNELFFANAARALLLPINFKPVPNGKTMKSMINATVGAIGYDTANAVFPVDDTGPKAVNLQVFSTIGKAPVFLAAAARNAAPILGTVKPPSAQANSCPADGTGTAAPNLPSTDGICADNALNWGLAFPAPTSPKAYPIGGFTFINSYSCYASADTRDALVGTTPGSLGLWRWYFGSNADNRGLPKVELNRNSFTILPGSWVNGIKKLLITGQTTRIGVPGQLKTGCATVSGGA